MKGVQLTSEEKQLLVEALLFSSHVDVNAEWSRKHESDMVALAKKLYDNDQKLSNIFIFEGHGEHEDPAKVAQLRKDFPGLPTTNMNPFIE